MPTRSKPSAPVRGNSRSRRKPRKANAKGKIAKPAGPRLYNLDIDIGEKTNVAAEHPEIVKRLEGYVEQMDSDLGVNKNGPGVRPPDRVENPKPLLKRVDTEYD